MTDSGIAQAKSLKEQYGGPKGWEQRCDPIFRFYTEGDWWGLPFFSVSATRYFSDQNTLFIYWSFGTVAATGPMALAFYTEFCAHRATGLKADGKDILTVKLQLNEP